MKRGMSELEALVDLEAPASILASTREYLASSPDKVHNLASALWAFNNMIDLPPVGGDCLLPYQEAFQQLRDSVALAFGGFYSQALGSLRIALEMSLLQSSLPIQSPSEDSESRPIWPLGVRAEFEAQSNEDAPSVESWAVNGGRTPRRAQMLDALLHTDPARKFDRETCLRDRINGAFAELDKNVHVRGWLKSGVRTRLTSSGFSEETLSVYITQMLLVTQLALVILLLAFSPL
jgi:hypothetical protein